MLGTSDHKKINGNRLWDDKLLNQPWDYLFVSDRVPKNEWQYSVIVKRVGSGARGQVQVFEFKSWFHYV